MPKVGDRFILDASKNYSSIYTLVRDMKGRVALTRQPNYINTGNHTTWAGFYATKTSCHVSEEEFARVCGGYRSRECFMKIEDGHYCEQKRRKCLE